MADGFTVQVEALRRMAREDLGTLWFQLWTGGNSIATPQYLGGDTGAEHPGGRIAGAYANLLQTLHERQTKAATVTSETKGALTEIAEVYAIADGQE